MHVASPHVFPIAPNRRFDDMAGFPVRFVAVYTGISDSLTQSTGMAFSNDLHHWVRYDGNPILQPAQLDWAVWSRTTQSSCRDPFVMRLADRYIIYYTALRRDGDMCVAAAESSEPRGLEGPRPVHTMPFCEISPAMLESPSAYPIRRQVCAVLHAQGRHTIRDFRQPDTVP